MRRPPGLWILLSAGVLWLSLQDVYGIRATSLIFGKSTTTTTTTDATSSKSSPSDETATEASTEASNVTKPTLTGNPQLDYIWDPNLPKELNGYNLSEYPFYERVPDEEIEFKCDGLHDGFYASVPHKCQVYHHCLFGTRYDFLCANYTAFDQKTFICQFVSVVDCVNSKKYWHRNDALYQAASTTTVKPVVVQTAPPIDYAPQGAPPRRPMEGRRRPPYRRRRPQYDYYDDLEDEYDDYYEERPRFERRRKRPRPRPRPVYPPEYEDEEFEDDKYERRNSGRRNEERRKTNRRGEDDRRPDRRRNNKDRRKYEDDDKVEDEDVYEDDRKIIDNKRPPSERRSHKRRPSDDEEVDRRRSRPKGRPIEDDYEEEVPKNDKAPPPLAEDKPMIKPSSGSSIYDRPRVAPRIKPPVPKTEANKYAYKPTASKASAADDEEYYDDYEEEEELPPKSVRKSEASEARRHTIRREETRDTRKQMASASRLRSQPSRDDSYEEETPRRPAFKPKFQRDRPRANSDKKIAPVEDDYEEYEEVVSKERTRKEKSSTTTTTTTTPRTTKTTTTTTPKPTTTTPKDMPKPETIVRIVKRPFLPSRGGNPYSSRGLQPVGAKAIDKKPENEDISEEIETTEVKPVFKPSPPVIKMPFRQKYATSQSVEEQEEFKPVPNRSQVSQRQSYKPNKEYSGPRTTQKPKLLEPDPLDNIEEDEYDVTLNDALNPTLPNLPVRSFPTGFSPANDYYNPVQRPRYVLEGASSDYTFSKPVRQRYETVPYSGTQNQFVNSDADYNGQYSTVNRQSYRPRVTQAYYSSF